MQIEYETKRLILRLSSPVLAPQIQSFYKQNYKFFSKNETLIANTDKLTLNDYKTFLMSDEAQYKNGRDFRFWIFLKGSEECIGCVALTNIVRGNMECGYLNYKLAESQQHNGYMIEAAKFCVVFAFEKLGLHRIEADILPGNYTSVRIVQKLGFKNDGIAEKILKVNGTWRDHVRMILINPCT